MSHVEKRSDVEFWLFPPQGDKGAEARGWRYTDICEEILVDGLVSIAMIPSVEETDLVAKMGADMVHGIGAFRTQGDRWRDRGLCLVAIAAEAGDNHSRTILAKAIAVEIEKTLSASGDPRVPPQWVPQLRRRIADLLSGRERLAPNVMPHVHPVGSDRIDGLFLMTVKADARSIHEVLQGYVDGLIEQADPGIDDDVMEALKRVSKTRCCHAESLSEAATLLARGRADGHLHHPMRAARALHWAAACLGERRSMVAVVEYLLQEVGEPRHAHEVEAIYSLIHGWLTLACIEFRRFREASMEEPIRSLGAVTLDLQKGPFAPVSIVDGHEATLNGAEAAEAVGETAKPPKPKVGRKVNGLRRPGSKVSLARFNDDDGMPDDDDPWMVQMDDSPVANVKKADKATSKPRSMSHSFAGQLRGMVVVRDLAMSSKAHQDLYAPLTETLALAAAPDPERIRTILKLEFPWFERVIDMVCDDLWQRRSLGDPSVRFRPILLAGKAGVGKTTFALRLAELLGAPAVTIPAAGSATNQWLKGLAKGYHGAHPSGMIEFMLRKRCPNPIGIVDEIDKVGDSNHNGNVALTLLDLLEPQTSRAWLDECLCSEVDLSAVSWILTANRIDMINGPLLSRCRVFEATAPKPEHFYALYHSIVGRIASDAAVRREELPQLDEVEVEALRRSFLKNPTARSLRSKVERLIGLRSTAAPVGALLN